MHNLMQDWPLRVGAILDHAARYHPKRKIITRTTEGPITQTNYKDLHKRARKVSQAVSGMGLGRGDVVGVMAWNTARHMEIWYGVPGSGAVLHTLNPRLFAEQLAYIINHAENKVLMVDFDLLPVIEAVWDQLTTVRHVIVLTDTAHMPESKIPNIIAYEDWIEAMDGDFDWVKGDENDACGICYTSGTTGNPKGVVYTHRSNTLHAMAALAPDMLNLSSRDTIMPVVPLFHANGWAIAFSAPMAGAAMVLPGRDLSGAGLYQMLEMGVNCTAAVPTLWMMLLQYMQSEQKTLSTLKRVVIGGASCPRSVIETFQNVYGVQVLHAWGMTEMSPLGTVCSFKPEIAAGSDSERLDTQETVGHPPFSIDLKIEDDAGEVLPWDGNSQGKLLAKGPAVVKQYLKGESSALDRDGWFDTGDVATMDENGYVKITDRSKDVIKSGGEWISSIELENAALNHPDVAEAAAIGIADEKWGERPILVVVRKPDTSPEPDAILDVVGESCAKWQRPDKVVFMDEIPHTATGKISKMQLREIIQEMGYSLPH